MNKQRRVVLKGIGAGATALWLPPLFAEDGAEITPVPCIDPADGGAGGSAGTCVGTRLSVNGMANDHPTIISYRKAVEAMRALPTADPLSWESQARIHLNFCPHGNWYFLPWHRAYLQRFEAICVELSGDPQFRLPYWDWSADPRVPAPFWVSGSGLNHPRAAGPNDRAEEVMIGQAVIDDIVLPEEEFEEFASGASATQRGGSTQGPLEGRAHNHIHGFIGRDMGTFLSPRDPVFWLHHANVDRIWAQWNKRGNGNTASSGWRDFAFGANFVDTAGNPVDVRVADMEDTRTLGYVYDDVGSFDVPAPAAIPLAGPEAAEISFTGSNDQRSVPGKVVSIPVPANIKQLRRVVSAAEAAGPDRVFAVISDIDAPENEQMVVRVFVNKPDATPETSVDDPHFAGSFGFFVFSHARKHGHAQSSFRVELTKTLQRLAVADGGLAPEFTVQLLPVVLSGRDPVGTEFTAHNIEIVAR